MKTEKHEEPEINKKITLTFLEKVEILNERERRVIIDSIDLINNPVIITGTEYEITK